MPIDFPSNPTNGQVYANYIYDSSITAWRNVNTDTGIGTLNAMGLKNVVPASVTVASGSATTNSNGSVTFTGATSISLNNVFSSTYQQYKIVFTCLASSTQDVFFRFRNNTTDIANDYYGVTAYTAYNAAVANWSQANAATSAFIVRTGTSRTIGTLDVRMKEGTSQPAMMLDTYNIAQAARFFGGYNAGAADINGFTIFSTSLALTGTVTVYGLTN